MTPDAIAGLLQRQRTTFHSGATRSVAARRALLDLLDAAIRRHEAALFAALKQDLGKSDFEAYTTEVGLVYKEIKHARKRLARWSRPRRARTDLHNLPGSSRLYPEPYGVCLIIAPWNYPVQLLLSPLVGAIAAGNTAVVKPSEVAAATAAALQAMFDDCFDPALVAAVCGDAEFTSRLLDEPCDKIFFTGSVPVGRIVMEKAARRLTPVTLELGGKSPVIVDHSANLGYTARKIVWGKYLNAGQTCVAPDYLLVEGADRAAELVALMRTTITEFYGTDPLAAEEGSRIINGRHFQRLTAMLGDGDTSILGGRRDAARCRIEPTIIFPADPAHPSMTDEIFGPILPVIPRDSFDDCIAFARERPKPLAAYLFSESRANRARFLSEVSCGGGGINSVVLHVASTHLPFGGVGPSGLGSYHGKASFDAFTHWKGFLQQSSRFELKIAYPGREPSVSAVRKLMG
ncbi:MAG: aldehyde dehydrogenase family protein [Spirochaetaceae bacterium]|nr:MAG: aldehyde dehydrogenase family protein [Spirochaetaceae bacterium]